MASDDPRGEAASADYERHGWASVDLGCAVFTIYRRGHSLAFTDTMVTELLDTPRGEARRIGWFKHEPGNMAANDALEYAIAAANDAWFGYDVAGIEQPAVHRYPVGARFPRHSDRVPMRYKASLCGLRAVNAVVMLKPARRGGGLVFDLGAEPVEIDLDPADVLIYDANVIHEVTEIKAGQRVTFVTHAVRANAINP